MSSSFLKIIFYSYIFINLFINSICDDKCSYECGYESIYSPNINNTFFDFCDIHNKSIKFKLDNQGNIIKCCGDIKNESISSLVINDELLLYNYQLKNGACNYYSTYQSVNSLEECRNYNTSDNNNLCCFLRETEFIEDNSTNSTNFITSESCIEVNKYEIDRFKGINSNKFGKYKNENITGKFYLACDSSFSKINKFIFYFLFLYLYF